MASDSSVSPRAVGIAGAAGTFVGVGLGRFAYTPMIPAMVEAGWFTGPEAAYLGATNLVGYLVGAVAADPLARRFGPVHVILAAFVAVTVSLLFCAWPAPYYWFAFWRLVAGVGGGLLMVVGGSTAIMAVGAAQRPRTAALVFTGVGLGILASAVVVPAMLRLNLTSAWLGIAAAAALSTFIAWPRWRRVRVAAPAAPAAGEEASGRTRGFRWIVAATLVAYAMEAVGFVPHTIFWADYLAREAGFGMDVASVHWAIFGLGATLGATFASQLARWIGWRRGFSTALLIKSAAVAIPVATSGWLWLAVSSFVVGTLVPAMVVMASGRLAELVGAAGHRRVWGYGTAAFATAQALAGYGYAGLFAWVGSYRMHFAIAAGALVFGGLLALAPWHGHRQTTASA